MAKKWKIRVGEVISGDARRLKTECWVQSAEYKKITACSIFQIISTLLSREIQNFQVT